MMQSQPKGSHMNQLSLFDSPAVVTTDSEVLISEIRAFDKFGRATGEECVDGIPYLINEFWTSGQRKSHSIHEVSYRACFKAQLPEFFIERLTKPGDVVYDPFMGRGTTPIQAAIMKRRAVGNDINPLSTLLTRPRLRPVTTGEVAVALREVDWGAGEITREDLLVFYHPSTLKKLEALKLWLNDRAPLDSADPERIADWIRMIAINRLSGHSSGFFSGRSMPPNQAVSVRAQEKINAKLGVAPPERDIPYIINKKTRSLLRNGCLPKDEGHGLFVGAAWQTPNLPNGSVDLVVTSPPFLDIVQYAADNWLRCWFAGIEPESVDMAIHRTEGDWMSMVHETLREQARVVRRGGYIAFEVGEVRSGKVLLEKLVWQAAENLPFDRLAVMVNDQKFTKTANCWGVANGSKGTNTNRIVLLRRR